MQTNVNPLGTVAMTCSLVGLEGLVPVGVSRTRETEPSRTF